MSEQDKACLDIRILGIWQYASILVNNRIKGEDMVAIKMLIVEDDKSTQLLYDKGRVEFLKSDFVKMAGIAWKLRI